MELVDYPQAIKTAAQQCLKLDQQVEQLQKKAERLKFEMEQSVAFDSTLKNQNQRDCRRSELLRHHAQYQATYDRVAMCPSSGVIGSMNQQDFLILAGWVGDRTIRSNGISHL